MTGGRERVDDKADTGHPASAPLRPGDTPDAARPGVPIPDPQSPIPADDLDIERPRALAAWLRAARGSGIGNREPGAPIALCSWLRLCAVTFPT